VENIANSSAPLITLLPPLEGDPFNLELLAEFAQDVALFNSPAFVQLFPVSTPTDLLPSNYTNFFRAAHAIFEENALNTALIWGFEADMQAHAAHFFPGVDYVHWVNLILYNEIGADGTFADITEQLGLFHSTFGQDVPLMLTTAVSSYSRESNRHFPAQAGEKIEGIYSRLASFPRIRAIIYQNYSDLTGRGAEFRVNASQVLTEAYQNAVSAGRFLNEVQDNPHFRLDTIIHHSPYRAVSYNFGFYIPTNAISLPSAPQVRINGQAYHNISHVLQAGGDFYVNFREGTLTIIQ